MPDTRTGQVWAWVIAGILVLLLASSFSLNGTWMGGMGMGWMVGIVLVLLALAIWVAYRFGRLEQKVEDADTPR